MRDKEIAVIGSAAQKRGILEETSEPDVAVAAEETAHLAGMETSQWLAIEAGYVPADTTQLRSMAGALECGYEKLAMLAFICQGAWKQ